VLAPSGLPIAALQGVVDELRAQIDCERCTLRLDVPGAYSFPVVCEALAPGVASLRSFTTLPQLAGPTFRRIARERTLVVQNDCRHAAAGGDPEFAEPYFRALIDLYGGMAAFIAAPIWRGAELEGVISLHALGEPRAWSATDVAAAERAQHHVTEMLVEVGRVPAATAAGGLR
jgi:GAF domain-containing protein